METLPGSPTRTRTSGQSPPSATRHQIELHAANETALERATRDLTVKDLAVLGLFAFVISLFLMLAGGVYLLAHSNMKAKDSIDALKHDELANAIDLMGDAKSDAGVGLDMLRDPILGFFTKVIPYIDHERESLVVAGRAAENITIAADDFLGDLSDLVGDQGLGNGLYDAGAIRVDLVEQMVPLVDGLLTATQRSLDILKDVNPTRFSVVDARIRTSRLDLNLQQDGLKRLRAVAAAAPELLGGNGERTYLLAFQSPSEARGGGGLVGVDGILELNDGAIDLKNVEPIRKLLPPLKKPVDAPAWFESAFGTLGATKDPRLANLSPSFPATADVLSKIYERRTGVVVDGVISMDPLVLGALTKATGPLSAPGWSVRITNANARSVLLEQVYEHFHGREGAQNGYFKNLVDVVMNRISSGTIKEFKLVEALAESVSKQRLKIYSADPATQELLSDGGVSGDPMAFGEDVQMVFNNNFSANKIDYYLRRSLDIHIHVNDTGEAQVETKVTLFNDVPEDAETNVLIKPGVDQNLPLGTNQMTLYAIIPASAHDPQVIKDGTEIQGFIGLEGIHKMIWDVVTLGPGETKSLTFRYKFSLTHELNLTLIPQATVRPDHYMLTIDAEDGLCLSGRGGNRRASLRSEGVLKIPRTLFFDVDTEAC